MAWYIAILVIAGQLIALLTGDQVLIGAVYLL